MLQNLTPAMTTTSKVKKLSLGARAAIKLDTTENQNISKRIELTGSEKAMFKDLCSSLSNYYTERLCQIQQPLCSPKAVQSLYSDVYLVEKGTNLDQVEKRGNKLKSYEEIFFSSANTSSKRLLLFGHPGSGKTTLAAKLASDWVNSKDDPTSDWFQTMLVVLPLRHMISEMSFVGGVKYILTREVRYDNDSLQDLLRKLKGRLYIIFDGFDEVNPDTLRGLKVGGPTNGGAKCTLSIDTIIHGDQLPNAHVLVITRPSALSYFTERKGLITFEICGFQGKKLIEMFIQNIFSDKRKVGEDLWKVINGNSFLIDISKTPMFLALICGLVHNENQLIEEFKIIKKMGPFLKLFWDSFLFHFVKKLQQQGKGNAMLEKVKGKMEYLTERLRILALNGLVDNQKQTWESQYVKDFLEEGDANMSQEKRKELLGSGDEMDLFTFAQESGILRVISPGGMSTRRGSKLKEKHIGYQEIISFYHKLFQEQCAGDYLGQMALSNPTKFKEYLAKLKSKSEVLSMKCLFYCACYRGKWEATHAILDHLIQLDCQTPSGVAMLFECFYENPDGCRSQSVGFGDLMSVKEIIVKHSDSSYTKDAVVYGLKSLPKIQKLELKGCNVEYNQDVCSVLVEKEVEELKISGRAAILLTKIRPMPFLKQLVLSSLKVFSKKAMNSLLDWSLKSSACKPKEISIEGKKTISWQDLSGPNWKIVTNATHKSAVVELEGCQHEYWKNKEGEWKKLKSEKKEVSQQQSITKERDTAIGSNDMWATKFIDQRGGRICIENRGVELTIPQDALTSEGAQITISVPVDEVDAPNDFDFVVSLAPVIKLMPNNQKFLKPYTLKVPHCAIFTAEAERPSVMVYVGHENEDGKIMWILDTEETRIRDITKELVIVESTHFTLFRLRFPNYFVKEKGLRICAICDSCVEILESSSSATMYRIVIDIWCCNSDIDSNSLAPNKLLLKENFTSVERDINEPLQVWLKKTKPEWRFSDEETTATVRKLACSTAQVFLRALRGLCR